MVESWHEVCFDLTRGIAAYTGSGLIGDLAKTIARHPEARIGTAFSHKQVASKVWARDALHQAYGGRFAKIRIVGGWYGVLAAMLFDDPRFEIGLVENLDIDPEVGAVARTLNGRAGARFVPVTADMYAVDYRTDPADLTVNTSCEHIPDLRAWLALLPAGSRVLLQSNDYFSEPTHIASVPTLADFEALAGLAELRFSGTLPTRKYNRFMLVGTT
jgi:hypothetical protein